MKQVQQALKALAMPVFPDVWRPLTADQNPPAQYVVYTTSTVEDEKWDDAPRSERTYVYMNLWSDGDPTEAAKAVRRAMNAAGFGMIEQFTGSGSSAKYNESTQRHCVSWTWVLYEDMQ